MCYVDVVNHREMRNQSADLLRRVEAGESLVVTNHGRPVAVISPVGRSVLDRLMAEGQGRRALRGVESLRSINRRPSAMSTAQIVEDSRGTW